MLSRERALDLAGQCLKHSPYDPLEVAAAQVEGAAHARRQREVRERIAEALLKVDAEARAEERVEIDRLKNLIVAAVPRLEEVRAMGG